MVEREVSVSGWSGVQRRVRRLAPAPVRRADLRAFRAVARTHVPVVGPLLPRLSRAANHSKLWFAIAALLAGVGGRSGRRAALRGALAIGATSTIVNLPAKLLSGRARPDVTVVPVVRQLAQVPMSTSFPSGHSASAFAFATAVSLEEPRLRTPLLILAGAVATSRVYTGVHYPGDVLVGSAIGVAVARASTRTWPLPDTTPTTASPAELPAPPPERDGTGLVLVENIGAGNPVGTPVAARLREALPGARVVEAEPDEEFAQTLERAARQARVLGVAGGDGSASAAAAAAHAAGVPLALVPAGTLNHLARDLGIEDLGGTVAALREERCVAIDLAEVDGRPFVNAVGMGLYPDLVDLREQLQGAIGKWPAAILSTVRLLAGRREPYEIEIDGERRLIWTLFVGNGSYTTDGPAPTRRRHLDDGRLDVRVLRADGRWPRTQAAAGLLTGWSRSGLPYERWTARELELASLEGPLRLACDGETVTVPARVTIRKRQGPLLVMQPRPTPAPR